LTVPVCAVVVEITTKRTFIQPAFLKAGLGTLQPMKAVFFKTFPSDQKVQLVL